MKKAALCIAFGVLGVVFQWLLPFAVNLLWPSDGAQYHGEDEAGRQLQVYFLLGGALFFALGAWVGSVWASDRRKAARMMVGILVATGVILLVPRLVVPTGLQFDDWGLDAVFMGVWAAVSAVCAYGLGRRPLRFAADRQDLR